MAVSSDTTAAFKATVKELGLEDLWNKFDANGWDTFTNFAFSTADPSCKDIPGFEKEVVPQLIDIAKPDEKKLLPLIRRLFAQSYAVANSLMASEIIAAGPEQKVHLTPADRQERVAKLKGKLIGFDLKGASMPSSVLVDKFVTILAKGHVLYVAWDRLTSRDQEMQQEHEVKGLRFTQDGVFVQDVTPEFSTSLAG